MSWVEDTKLRFKLAAFILAFMCPVGLIAMTAKARQQVASYSWSSVEGVVLSTTAKEWRDEEEKTTKYFGRVVYQYSVEGKEYETDLTDLGPGLKRADEFEALLDVKQYAPGQRVTVYYDPADPQTGVLEKGIPPIHQFLFALLTVLTLVGWVASVLIVRGWLRKRRAASADPAGPGS